MSCVTIYGNVDVRIHNSGEQFEILQDFDVHWNSPYTHYAFTIKKGFITDGPSIPHRARFFIPWTGKHLKPSIIHDWCYEDNVPGLTKEEADLMFKDAMQSYGVPWHDRLIMWKMVDWFGDKKWG